MPDRPNEGTDNSITISLYPNHMDKAVRMDMLWKYFPNNVKRIVGNAYEYIIIPDSHEEWMKIQKIIFVNNVQIIRSGE